MKILRKEFVCPSIPALWRFFLLFYLIVHTPPAWCSEPPNIAGKTQMSLGGQQVLSIMNYQTGETCAWSIEDDDGQKGSLSGSTGERVTYTAPASNPDCANNPTVVVSRNGEEVGSFSVAVNAVTGNQTAYTEIDNWISPLRCNGEPRMCGSATCKAYCLRWRYHRCDGAFLQEYSCEVREACDPNISNKCFDDMCEPTSYSYYPIQWCLDSCQGSMVPGTTADVRTEAMKAAGCCPDLLFSWYEPERAVPEDRLHGQKPLGGAPVCPVDRVSNPISVLTGNNTEGVEDLRFATPFRKGLFIKRFYNSRQPGRPPVGHGWIHNYHLVLSSSFEFEGDTYLRIVDGTYRKVYFQDAGGGLFVGAFGEPTTVETDGAEYVWHRLDGSRYVFVNQSGTYRITRIEDEVGNRQAMAYHDSGDLIGRLETVTDEASGRILTFHYTPDRMLDHITGPVTAAVSDGVWVTYGYDADQNLTSVTYPDGSGFNYIYGDPNDPYNLTEKHDKAGHLLSSWTYDSEDRATESFTREGDGVTINYVNENKVRVTDAYGVTRTYHIWKIDGVKEVTDIDGQPECPGCGQEVKRLEYDSALNIIEVEYAKGLINQYGDYDSRGNAGTFIEALGTADERTITRTFHPDMGAKLTETRASLLGAGNKVTIWDYDNDGNTTPNENPTRLLHRQIEQGLTRDITGSVIPYEYITTYTYNANGQVLSIDGPEPGTADTTTFAYDPTTGNLLTVTRPEVGATTYSDCNAAGQVARVTDPNGNAVTYTYDGRGRVLTMTNVADSSVTTYAYDTAGELDMVTQPNGVTSDFVYGLTYGRLTQVIDPLGNYIAYGYDGQGNRTELSHYDAGDQRRFWKRFDYQGSTHPGKLWKEINPDDTYTEYTYDAGDNVSTITDAASKTTTYDYDLLDRLTFVTQPGNVITSYDYDQQGNLITVTDAESHVTTYVYDDLGRLVETVSSDTGTTRYAYDGAGNLVSKADARGITVTYAYDDLNRLTAIHFPDSAQDITYTYDDGANGKGRLTGMSDASGSYTYTYDVLGNLVTEEKIVEGVTHTTQYAYDEAGILTGMTYPDGRTVTYGLDTAGRVTAVTTTKESVTSTLAENIGYLPFGPLQAMTYGNGTAISKTFDQLYRLTDLEAGTVQSLDYALDPVGNITAITDSLDSSRNQSFGYDDLYRLTSAAGIYGTMGYTYDKVGNRLAKTVDTQTDTYAYEAGTNRLSAITGASPESFAYDANGNTTGMGDKTLIYNQNNRLIEMAENSTTLGEYVYNGNGQRIKKTADGDTTIYHYDRFGNLIGESTPSGEFLTQYVYLDNMRLAAIAEEAAREISVHVGTSAAQDLAGVPVYAFTEAGSYTGKNATTDEDGLAHFGLSEFSDGSYKFRADYLSYQFWSEVITLPGTYSATVEIAEETTTVQVIQGGSPKQGIKVYLFNASGSYLGIYATTDENGDVSFDLPAGKDFKFRADNLGSQFWSEVVTVVSGGPNDYEIDTGGGMLTVTVDKGEGTPISGINVYLFKGDGTAYLGLSDQTDGNGQASFEVPSGTYIVRADYLGYQFWSAEISVTTDDSLLISIPHQDVTATVQGAYDGDVEAREELNVYLFTEAGSYLSVYHVTNAQGDATFNVPEKSYKVRADYLSQQYWSEVFQWEDKTVTIEEGSALVTMTHMGLAVEGVNVYVFTGSGSYLGLCDITDQDGQVSFRLPAGDYNFRGDFQGSQFWSGITTVIAHVENPVTISAGGGAFTLTVLKGVDDPLEGVNCYLFTDTGSYLGSHEVTSSQGEVVLNLADGDYKIRIDHLGYQFWTDVFTVPVTLDMEHTIAHQDVTITVESDYSGDVQALTDIKVYLFTPAGSYLGQYQTTDAQGQAVFNLPEQDYKVRADYLTKQYWSSVFNWTDETITINEGMAEVYVAMGASPIENVPVYVFNDLGTYLNITDLTDENGVVSFRLPEGTYKFRADHLSSQYWATEPVTAHQVNVINVDTGGGTFTFTAEKPAGIPLTEVPVYVFTSGGTYLGMTSQTDAQGQVTFDLSDGDYKFRADYLGYQFWSGVSTVPTTLSDVLTIPHQDVTITVERLYDAPAEVLESAPVYLFTEAGSYLGQTVTTDSQGEAVFNLPEQSYKVRADYLGYQFWSDPFTWTDTTVTIDHGMAVLHVTQGGADVVGAPVYLFTPSGSYLGKSETTDASGVAEFLLPDQQYKFRVDYDGSQYWSDVVTIIPHEENNMELNLDLLALDLTNDPNPVRYHGMAPELQQEKPVVALLSALPGLWVDSAYAQGGTEKLYFFINDHLGTPQKVIDEMGVVVWSADYRPFGEADVTVGTYDNNFRLPGQYYDQETGLHYNYFREYHPGIGRYVETDLLSLSQIQIIRQSSLNKLTRLSSDPSNIDEISRLLVGDLLYQYGLTNPQVLNLYPYVQDNPINYIDPNGLIVFPGPTGALGGGIVGAVTGAIMGGISGAEHGAVAGAIGGTIGGGLAGFGTGLAGGFISGTLGGGTIGGVAGSLAGTVIGEMLSPSQLHDEVPHDIVRKPIPQPWQVRMPMPIDEKPCK